MFSPQILFVTLLLVTNTSYGFDSSSRVQLFLNIFLKPFGVTLRQDVSDLHSTPWKTLNCTGHLQQLQACNSTVLNLFNSTTSREETLVNSLLRKCSSGRYKCLQQQVSESPILREWFRKVKVALQQLCRNQCWKIFLDIQKDCTQPKKESKMVGFTLDVLNTFCHEPTPPSSEDASYCTDYFIEGLLTRVHDEEVCNVAKAIKDGRCSSSCYQEILDFYHSLDSCVSLITDTMKKHSVSPSHNTFGVIVQNSTVMCGKNQPRALPQPTKSSNTTTTIKSQNQTNSTTEQSPPPRSHSLNGKLIAAIVVAVIVFGVAGAVLCRYLYQRCLSKPKIRFEDYGYSHLQLMQDQEDFYFNDDDDDHGLLDL